MAEGSTPINHAGDEGVGNPWGSGVEEEAARSSSSSASREPKRSRIRISSASSASALPPLQSHSASVRFEKEYDAKKKTKQKKKGVPEWTPLPVFDQDQLAAAAATKRAEKLMGITPRTRRRSASISFMGDAERILGKKGLKKYQKRRASDSVSDALPPLAAASSGELKKLAKSTSKHRSQDGQRGEFGAANGPRFHKRASSVTSVSVSGKKAKRESKKEKKQKRKGSRTLQGLISPTTSPRDGEQSTEESSSMLSPTSSEMSPSATAPPYVGTRSAERRIPTTMRLQHHTRTSSAPSGARLVQSESGVRPPRPRMSLAPETRAPAAVAAPEEPGERMLHRDVHEALKKNQSNARLLGSVGKQLMALESRTSAAADDVKKNNKVIERALEEDTLTVPIAEQSLVAEALRKTREEAKAKAAAYSTSREDEASSGSSPAVAVKRQLQALAGGGPWSNESTAAPSVRSKTAEGTLIQLPPPSAAAATTTITVQHGPPSRMRSPVARKAYRTEDVPQVEAALPAASARVKLEQARRTLSAEAPVAVPVTAPVPSTTSPSPLLASFPVLPPLPAPAEVLPDDEEPSVEAALAALGDDLPDVAELLKTPASPRAVVPPSSASRRPLSHRRAALSPRGSSSSSSDGTREMLEEMRAMRDELRERDQLWAQRLERQRTQVPPWALALQQNMLQFQNQCADAFVRLHRLQSDLLAETHRELLGETRVHRQGEEQHRKRMTDALAYTVEAIAELTATTDAHAKSADLFRIAYYQLRDQNETVVEDMRERDGLTIAQLHERVERLQMQLQASERSAYEATLTLSYAENEMRRTVHTGFLPSVPIPDPRRRLRYQAEGSTASSQYAKQDVARSTHSYTTSVYRSPARHPSYGTEVPFRGVKR